MSFHVAAVSLYTIPFAQFQSNRSTFLICSPAAVCSCLLYLFNALFINLSLSHCAFFFFFFPFFFLFSGSENCPSPSIVILTAILNKATTPPPPPTDDEKSYFYFRLCFYALFSIKWTTLCIRLFWLLSFCDTLHVYKMFHIYDGHHLNILGYALLLQYRFVNMSISIFSSYHK